MNKLLLSIELVPSSSWLNNVRAILTRKQWDVLRKQVYEQAWNICQICEGVGSKHPVECHEIWSYDDKTLIQKLEGMTALCPDCHMVKHMGLAQIRNKGDRALKHLMKVNKLKKKDADIYVANSFAKWAERSSKNWKLDISFLERYGIDVKQIKKIKKPKPKKIAILSAAEINDYVALKYVVDDDGFWKWFFSECPWGDTNLLDLDDEDDIIQPKYQKYFDIIKADFIDDADERHCLEIENDL